MERRERGWGVARPKSGWTPARARWTQRAQLLAGRWPGSPSTSKHTVLYHIPPLIRTARSVQAAEPNLPFNSSDSFPPGAAADHCSICPKQQW